MGFLGACLVTWARHHPRGHVFEGCQKLQVKKHFLFWVQFGVSNYTAPRPTYLYPAGMTYIGNGIYQLPDGTYTGDIPQGTNTSYWNNVVYPIGYPYGFSGGTMINPTLYYNAFTGAYGSLEETKAGNS